MFNFQEIKQGYSRNPLAVLQRLFPTGKIERSDYVVLNPRRNDKKLGSFKIDIATGKYHDFATRDSGGDIIDLVAFVCNCDLQTAAKNLSDLVPLQFVEAVPAKEKNRPDHTLFIWNHSSKREHPYLEMKGIALGNARVNLYKELNRIVVPLTDAIPDGESTLGIKALQFISEDGSKRFNLGIEGMFHVASGYGCDKALVVICEGFATARSISEAMPDLCVIACMSGCNMQHVALKLRYHASQVYQKAHVTELIAHFPYIIIAGDSDEAGRKAAAETEKVLGKQRIKIIYPTHGSDFNDMAKVVGSDNLKKYILNILTKGDRL